MIPAAASASTAASSSGSVSWDPWPPQRARNASQAPAKHFFFSHISCPNFSKNLSRHTIDPTCYTTYSGGYWKIKDMMSTGVVITLGYVVVCSVWTAVVAGIGLLG